MSNTVTTTVLTERITEILKERRGNNEPCEDLVVACTKEEMQEVRDTYHFRELGFGATLMGVTLTEIK